MKLTGIIYKITNIINNKVYIGQTVNTIKQRWNKHCHSNGCRSLYNAILKYGKENFNIEIIETLPIEELDEFIGLIIINPIIKNLDIIFC